MLNRTDEILIEWQAELEDVKHILRYLMSYPDVLSEAELANLVTPEKLIKHQRGWVELYLSYDGLEKDFFRPYWVPVNSSDYDYFMDLSDSKYPIFNTYFHWIHPQCYIRENLFNSVNDLMLAEDRNTDILNAVSETKSSLYGFDL